MGDTEYKKNIGMCTLYEVDRDRRSNHFSTLREISPANSIQIHVDLLTLYPPDIEKK